MFLLLAAVTAAQACDNVARCFAKDFATDKFGGVLNGAIAGAVKSVDNEGKKLFGDDFGLFGGLHYQAQDGSISGDLDAVIPVFSGGFSGGNNRAFFLQSGISRYEDSAQFWRDDLRQGIAYRFAVSENHDSAVAGFWAFIQQNRQRGHGRFATGAEYYTPVGVAKLHYFMPTTGWRAGRFGYEEKAIEGGDLLLNFDNFRRLGFQVGAGHWERKDGSEKFDSYAQVGARWQVLPQLSVESRWRGLGKSRDSMDFALHLDIPLGGKKQGFAAPRLSQPTSANLYRAITAPRRIEVAERRVAVRPLEGVAVRFLHNTATSGGQVRLEVILPATVSEDSDFEVHLLPGEGDNPAVAGVDFSPAPVPLMVRKGKNRAVITTTLMYNAELQKARTLAVKVYPVL